MGRKSKESFNVKFNKQVVSWLWRFSLIVERSTHFIDAQTQMYRRPCLAIRWHMHSLCLAVHWDCWTHEIMFPCNRPWQMLCRLDESIVCSMVHVEILNGVDTVNKRSSIACDFIQSTERRKWTPPWSYDQTWEIKRSSRNIEHKMYRLHMVKPDFNDLCLTPTPTLRLISVTSVRLQYRSRGSTRAPSTWIQWSASMLGCSLLALNSTCICWIWTTRESCNLI